MQALVLQRDVKKQATWERARADAFGGATTDEPQVERRAPSPESVRREVWRRAAMEAAPDGTPTLNPASDITWDTAGAAKDEATANGDNLIGWGSSVLIQTGQL